jgi:hypothetical protein
MPDPDPTPTPAPDPAPDPAKTFSQVELDKIVQDRLARERAKYEGFDALKAKADEFDKLQEANKSELEKAQARADKAEEAAKTATARAQETALKSAVIAEAARRQVVDPDAAFALLDRSTLKLDGDGSPTNIAEAMDQLLTAKPYLAAATGGNRNQADQGARGAAGNGGGTMTDLLLRATDGRR